jgi:hypothetical protein
MRRKPSSQGSGGYNNQQRRNRFQQGGGSGGGSSSNGGDYRSHGQHNRPRKNYAASREKYLAQARDALSAGDRVLAENYFQHADHCYRMMVEEGYNTRNNYTPPAQGEEAAPQTQASQEEQQERQEQQDSGNVTQLPAFLTAPYDQAQQARPVDPATIQNWEDRDA